jgi:uncharacterized protein (DUF488 family)
VIFTIGHSTHTAEAFATVLQQHAIAQLADVRTIPHSRRHPHFARDALDAFLASRGVFYRHFPGLGGRRRPRADSRNTAWREAGFRGYADYMETPAFGRELQLLVDFSDRARTVVMCAEAVWWRCHRRLLADALVVRGVPVFHILSSAPPKPHELSEFAVVTGGQVRYPGLM